MENGQEVRVRTPKDSSPEQAVSGPALQRRIYEKWLSWFVMAWDNRCLFKH